MLVMSAQSACGQAVEIPIEVSPQPAVTPPPQAAFAEITFEVDLPEALSEGQSLYIEFLDEVSGLALNPSRAKMSTSDGQFFGIKIPVQLGSVVKYRYFRDKDPIGLEYTTTGEPVRYRLFYASGPGVVHDVVAGWRANPSSAVQGRIQGQVADITNNAPVVNALVAAGGLQTLTSSDGSFVLEGLQPGLHNLVVYSLDGAFNPFQQGAIVAPLSSTPATILLMPSALVTVHFIVSPPEGSPAGVPIRLLGNTYALGNTFADLAGGMNVLASRAPLMQPQPDGTYTLSLQLPVGLDLRYKYSLGDGLWNAELSSSMEAAASKIVVRQLVVPDKDVTIQDHIGSWKTPGINPITFTVTVPEDTPSEDVISIQFNPFGWTQPIPMWRIGPNRWVYVLYSPLDLFSNATYRYCRNEQCSFADAVDTAGPDAKGKTFSTKEGEQKIEDTVEEWSWTKSSIEPVVISGSQIQARSDTFVAGVEFSPLYQPSWQQYMGGAFRSARETGGNIIVLAPTWHATHVNPPVLAPETGKDPLWFDLSQMNSLAQQQDIGTALHPMLRYNGRAEDWWESADRDEGWWQTWFARYTTFMVYHADLATQTGAKILIIGDDSILPALQDGKLTDGSPSRVPSDASIRWDGLIKAVKARFKGKIAWMVSIDGSDRVPPAPPDNVDLLYAQITPPLSEIKDGASNSEIETAMVQLIDGKLLEIQENTDLPVIISIHIPSVSGILDGCAGSKEPCLPPDQFSIPGARIDELEPALEEQAYAYNAALSAINQRSWITGIISTGYYPPAELRDLSFSVRGKPAEEVLWYWYPQMLGKTSP